MSRRSNATNRRVYDVAGEREQLWGLGLLLPHRLAREHWLLDRRDGESECYSEPRYAKHKLPVVSRLGVFHEDHGARSDRFWVVELDA